MDQTKNLKENSSLIQTNEVIRRLHRLLRDSNDKKVSSEAIHLESFLISIGEELNDKDFKEDRNFDITYGGLDDNESFIDLLGTQCEPPSDHLIHYFHQKRRESSLQELCDSLSKVSDSLLWIHPNNLADQVGDEKEFKCVSIIGNKRSNSIIESGDVHLGLMFLAPGISFPQHAREAKETCLILSGTPQIGATMQHLKRVTSGTFLTYENAAPRVFKVPADSDPLLMLFLRTGEVNGKFWLKQSREKSSGDAFLKNIIQNYDDIADDYEDLVRSWGYNMPEVVINALMEHGQLSPSLNPSILDLACGDGLCGQYLKRKGFDCHNVTGTDISAKMLQVAREKECYQTLLKLDLTKEMPYLDNTFDNILCVGSTTYLVPSVLEDWIRVTKGKGMISFTHKTTIWPNWEPSQKTLEEQKKWKLIWVSEPLHYLPSYKGYDLSEMVKVYIYQKL